VDIRSQEEERQGLSISLRTARQFILMDRKRATERAYHKRQSILEKVRSKRDIDGAERNEQASLKLC